MSHPRDGLTLFGPFSSKGVLKPPHIRYGIVGTPSGVSAAAVFFSKLREAIPTAKDYDPLLWAPFPGFEEAFHAVLPTEATWIGTIDAAVLDQKVHQGDQHKRVHEVTDLYLEAIQKAKRSDVVCDVFVCVVPDIVWQNCRVLQTHIRNPIGPGTPNRKEARLRQSMDDLFGAYDPSQYGYSLDFRRQIKARVMEHETPIQILRESTLIPGEPNDDQRQLTPLSDRAWNLSTALYYKAGGKPWKLSGARDGVCYIGIAFKDSEDKKENACCAAQMFLSDGDGVVFMGDEGKFYSEKQGEYHIPRNVAKRLLEGILKTYSDQHGKPLKEIFLHCRSAVNDNEYQGYLDACPKEVKLVIIRVAPDRSGFRLYRGGTFPVMRGSFWQVSDRACFLWGSGFKPRLRTYDGSEVPVPLAIRILYGEASIEQVARDILGLTKLNYNASKLGEFQPVTIRFSEEVGEILLANRKSGKRLPNFKYYI